MGNYKSSPFELRSMKGISIAIETIIYIIIAVLVLGVLLAFLLQGTESKNQIEARSTADINCGYYIRNAPKCDKDASSIGDIKDQSGFAKACKLLYPVECTSPTSVNQACAKKCCSFLCPRN